VSADGEQGSICLHYRFGSNGDGRAEGEWRGSLRVSENYRLLMEQETTVILTN
jgi:hypothetical protein